LLAQILILKVIDLEFGTYRNTNRRNFVIMNLPINGFYLFSMKAVVTSKPPF
jgi:hypothetical protein